MCRLFSPCRVASSKETLPSRTDSSTLRPVCRFVRRPCSIPRMPPRAAYAARDFGLRSLLSWPGENANLLSETSKSLSVPGSGLSASSRSVAPRRLHVLPFSPCEVSGTFRLEKAVLPLSDRSRPVQAGVVSMFGDPGFIVDCEGDVLWCCSSAWRFVSMVTSPQRSVAFFLTETSTSIRGSAEAFAILTMLATDTGCVGQKCLRLDGR